MAMPDETDTPPTDEDGSPPTFPEADDFRDRIEEGSTVRILVEPETPLRGRDHHDGYVSSVSDVEDGTRVVVRSDELVEGDLPDNYERVEVGFRFTVPSEEGTPIEVTSDWTGRFKSSKWQSEGYLVGGGVLEMIGTPDE